MKAVGVSVTWEDGTVERWSGADANEYVEDRNRDIPERCSPEPTTTKPLRRVTEVEGRVDRGVPCIMGLSSNGSEVPYGILDLLPCGVDGDDAPDYRFRITVEAVPVEVKP